MHMRSLQNILGNQYYAKATCGKHYVVSTLKPRSTSHSLIRTFSVTQVYLDQGKETLATLFYKPEGWRLLFSDFFLLFPIGCALQCLSEIL